LANYRLRDRDAIISKEGLIFRVFGYNHPEKALICDAEYASADKILTSREIEVLKLLADGKFSSPPGVLLYQKGFRLY